ncbi:DUF4403 family protein [Siphonobacter sp. SORGH_AS_0500]|uniref:DUF4403 family protein n=1 Tax=Siphonobacter sp. SORGH_AS_0500 TaxID=1864824 RepID=UPI0028667DBE|nr:DUF4403 family protein [Siphonobacter sp. SORGH_AS_0500]MDR6194641.1 hypothetical protein [Siphonobacter sp. SORGH_AS_0500]
MHHYQCRFPFSSGFWAAIGFLFLISLGGCQPKRSVSSNPPAPKESYLYTKKQVESRRYLSTINLPVDISLLEVERQINANLTDLIYEDLSYEDQDDLMARVWKRGRILVTPGASVANESSLNLKVPLKIWIKTRYSVLGLSTEKELNFEIDVRLSTRFMIAPNWDAHTTTKLEGYDWVTKPVLKLGPLSIPVAGLVEKALNSKKSTLEKGIDDAVAKNIEVKKYVIQAWNAALQPYQVSEKYRTWLKITPVSIQMSPLRTVGKTIQSTIGIQTYTETAFGEKPVIQNVTQVPDLKLATQATDEFKIGLVSELSHAEAERMVSDTVVGQKFTYGNYSVEVTSIKLYGDANALAIRAGLKGSIDGFIYFKGIPYYDPVSKSVTLRDMDYDLETRSFLFKTANWLLQSRLRKTLQSALTFPVGEPIVEAQKQIQALLTKNQVAKGVTLTGKIESITPDQVYLTSGSIYAVVFAKGKVQLHVDGL